MLTQRGNGPLYGGPSHQIAQKTGFDDEDMLAHIRELLSGSEAGAAGAAAGDDDAMAD